MGLVASTETSSKPGPSANTIRSYEPATGALLGEADVTGPDEVGAVVRRARRAQESWAALTVAERAARVLRFRDALIARQDELIDLLSRETGKPRIEALVQEIVPTAHVATYFAQRAPELLAPREVPMTLLVTRRSSVHYTPKGVVGVISPWNYPLFLPMRDVLLAVIAGNAVVLKPSEVTPLIALRAKDIWDHAGLPPDLFQVVTGYGATGAALIDAGIQLCVFTGGVATGRRVAAACGERLIPCVMELGGKAPLVVCRDADLERAARAAVYGGYTNAGQVCIAVERVYAHQELADRLEQRMTELVRELRVGDPAVSEVDVGAIIFPKQIEIAEAHIADALSKGARLLAGGHRIDGPGQFFEPTLLADCDHTMTVMREEIFGPVVPIMRVGSDEEAVRLANDSHLGLNAYVFTRDRRYGVELAERIEAGSVLVNDVVSNGGCAEAPFGGIKQSGFGRVLGDDSLREMCDPKHISVDRVALEREPYWFPYDQRTLGLLRRASRLLFGGGGLASKLGSLFD